MNAKDFVKGKDFSSSKGLPVGKTIIELENAEFKETPFNEDDGTVKLVNQVTIPGEDGEVTFNLPKSVMQKVQEAVERKASALEVNRSGKTRNDTKYVTYLLDSDFKVMKEN